MRLLALSPLLVLAACSDGGEQTQPKADAPAATQLTAGEWETTTEVTKVTQRDKGAPAVKTSEGSRTTARSCVAEADVKKPQPALFAGKEYECTNRDVYMRSGRINATLACTRPGLAGNIAILVNGTYTADTFEGTATTETSLLSEGDVKIEATLAGKRVGACPAGGTPS